MAVFQLQKQIFRHCMYCAIVLFLQREWGWGSGAGRGTERERVSEAGITF